MRTPIEGANSVLYAAVHPDLKGVSGKYFKDCKDGYTTAAARCVYMFKPAYNMYHIHIGSAVAQW